ncbi:MAG: ribosome biogenesis/translation initiation ATPase RLI [Candidatus Diapherotrites archaeon]|nr:ribosome biogenesis/translation initiation ATPase RLI [Candidatus Diapherotrites archaeon]
MFTTAKKRIAVIDYDQCSPQKCGGWYCESVCPVNRSGTECNAHEALDQPTISEETCIGCLICVKKCPFEAISIINLQIDPGQPIHQYGENQFRLHGFPLPKNGEVVGVLGQNGIGKTTALKILSGRLAPNLGENEKTGDYAAVAEHFRGKEAFGLFDLLAKGELKTAYKPQQVDLLSKTEKGKVRDLLRKVDEKNRFDQIVTELQLAPILERQLDQLSGGELQKVAIAATALKNADVYFIDEPSSFLDIEQRLGVSHFIRGLADEKTGVLVVEHDLVLLDYLSDKIHLMYGTPSVFGIVSQVKNSREGINEYLSGYSTKENYRFRSYGIEFFAHSAKADKKNKPFYAYPAMTKRLGEFELKINAGELHQHEVVGIVGKNGIGKTTFAKILAGQLSPDTGKLDQKMQVAYKPQHIQAPEKEQTVEELLRSTAAPGEFENLSRSVYTPLGLHALLPKTVQHLSGGELQRVAIALTLSKDAPLLLLDEPSAYLDVEQRIATAKTLRSHVEQTGKTCLLIDHDLLFIDYVSDRLLVFDGIPAVHGNANGPFDMATGMNKLLSEMRITLRRDPNSRRPRLNKPGSQLDAEQKQSGKYYYA